MDFVLRLDLSDIAYWASRYSDPREGFIENDVSPRFRSFGYLSKSDFLALCEWKSPRSQSRCASNSEEFIRAVTATAVSSSDEQLRIEVLTLLRGVSWPTASVILHFGFDNFYPILDFRALWSVGVDLPTDQVSSLYCFSFWRSYSQYCRDLACDCGVTMRVLDRALWQFSKENQHIGENAERR